MIEGWIKLYRQIIESEIFASEKGLKIWIWILIKANHKKRFVALRIGAGQSTIELERGELLFGRFSAEDELGIDGSTIYKWLKKMELLSMIELKSNSHYTIIKVNKYNEYNDIDEQESSSQITTKEQQSSSQITTKEQQSSSRVTTEEQQSNTLKNEKNDNNVKNEKNNKSKSYFLNQELESAFLSYIEMRKKIKHPMTDRAIQLAINELNKLAADNDELKIRIIEQSIFHSWQGLFPLKTSDNGINKEDNSFRESFIERASKNSFKH
jgi:hypothetical protein